MREHPIPQDVTGYKFHIVGNMTLKQFAEIAAGVIVAVILYNLNLVFFVKWPLIILAVSFGGALAFLPIEERPLDHWVITFFKRLYSPTKFYWKKKNEVPFAFTHKKLEEAPDAPEVEIDLTPARRKRIQEYFHSIQNPQEIIEPWEETEKMRVSSVLQAFDEVEVEDIEAKPQKVKPKLVPRIRNLSPQDKNTTQQVVFENNVSQSKPPAVATEPTIQPPIEPQPQAIEEIIPEPILMSEQPITEPSLPEPTKIEIPPESIPEPTYNQPQTPSTTVSQNKELPFPEVPQDPNRLVGMVLTQENKLVDRATVTIRNLQGTAIRSVKTNLLGQFFVTGTLPNGTYILDVKKEGFEFPEQQLVLNGNIVAPLEVHSVAPSK